MRKGLFLKLAVSNIRQNRRFYVPYFISGAFTVAMFYIIYSLSMNGDIDLLRKASVMRTILQLGTIVMGLFALIFLYYTNRFLITRRKREFGLFQLLGMEKRHVVRVVLAETVLSYLICAGSGILAGILLNKLVYMIAVAAAGLTPGIGFYISRTAIQASLIYFAIVFALLALSSVLAIYRTQAIDLIHAKEQAERQPKSKWLLALLGVALLGSGYAMSVMITDPIKAIFSFFIAVVLVILGTYLCFTAFSIVVLKALRANKRFYYHKNRMFTISGMIHRMNQNAIGLANICILSTMVLIMLSTTASLRFSQAEIAKTMCPADITVSRSITDDDPTFDPSKEILADIDKHLGIKESWAFRSLFIGAEMKDGTLYQAEHPDSKHAIMITVFPLEDYNRLAKTDVTLKPNEVLFSDPKATKNDTLTIDGHAYHIAGVPMDTIASHQIMTPIGTTAVLVVPTIKEFFAINDASAVTFHGVPTFEVYANVKASPSKVIDYVNNIAYYEGRINCSAHVNQELGELYGGFFFLGLFLGILFLVATVLIIYYKQISEGYEDVERFDILRRVGMSDREVRKTIRSQVLMVFFLPLVVAGVHVAFAFPMITKLMFVMSFFNTGLLMTVTALSYLAFAVLYFAIYSITTRAYYRIVRR